ncbi:MAG: ATP-binding protein, partial [Terrimicrobiaceae bacterium]
MLAARAYRREHPDALVVSTDSQLARTWLRLGTQGERCDMLALRHEENELVLEAIEVKTAKGAPRAAGDPDIVKALGQLHATLEAVREGVGNTSAAEAGGNCLAAPRNEMLKEVLVAGCMAREVPPRRRKLWAEWLERLFGSTPEQPLLRGLVIDVALGSAEDPHRQTLATEPVRIDLLHLTETTIEELFEPSPIENAEIPPDPSVPDAPELEANSPNESEVGNGSHETDTSAEPDVPAPSISNGGPASVLLGSRAGSAEVYWQVKIEQNPHLMLVGQPGTGKTTSLVNICRQLGTQGIAPIVFSYHDDIDEKLAAVLPDLVFSDASNLGFNPMEVLGTGNLAYIDSAGQLRDIFAAIYPDLGELQLATLYDAFKRSYEENGWDREGTRGQTPRFAEFLQILQATPRPDKGTRTLLNRLTELADRGFFEADTPRPGYLDTKHPIVLRLHETRAMAAQTAFAAFAFYRIYQDMFRRGRPDQLTHAVLFDEAHRASKLTLIPTMAKECRKFGISLIVASQEASDFAPELFAAIDSTLVLRVTDESARQIARNKVTADLQREMADRMKQLPNYEALAFGSQYGRSGVRIQLSE